MALERLKGPLGVFQTKLSKLIKIPPFNISQIHYSSTLHYSFRILHTTPPSLPADCLTPNLSHHHQQLFIPPPQFQIMALQILDILFLPLTEGPLRRSVALTPSLSGFNCQLCSSLAKNLRLEGILGYLEFPFLLRWIAYCHLPSIYDSSPRSHVRKTRERDLTHSPRTLGIW